VIRQLAKLKGTMMKNGIGIAAVLMSLLLAALPAAAATKVFLLGGQSNMAGCGVTADLAAPYNVSQPSVKLWNSWSSTGNADNGWLDLQGGFGFNGYTNPPLSMFGPEVSFGYALDQTVLPNDDIYLVKLGANSTILADHANQWSPNGGGTTYNCLRARVYTAMANLTAAGKSPQIAGMIWMQGESDAMSHADALAYQANLTNFIGKVRSDLNVPNMPFVIGRIDAYPWGATADNLLVRDAQVAVAGQVSNTSWINTDDIPVWTGNETNPTHYDPGHYSSQGQIILGTRFANQFIQTPEPSALMLLTTALLGALAYAWRRRGKCTMWEL
jgi:hypothetical protein